MIRRVLYCLLGELFFVGLGLLLFLLVAEDFSPGFVGLWFNLRLLVMVVGLAGISALLLSKNYDKLN